MPELYDMASACMNIHCYSRIAFNIVIFSQFLYIYLFLLCERGRRNVAKMRFI